MRLATIDNGTPDGRLVVISPDGAHYALAPVETLQQALESWDTAEGALRAVTAFDQPLSAATLRAPLPRYTPWMWTRCPWWTERHVWVARWPISEKLCAWG